MGYLEFSGMMALVYATKIFGQACNGSEIIWNFIRDQNQCQVIHQRFQEIILNLGKKFSGAGNHLQNKGFIFRGVTTAPPELRKKLIQQCGVLVRDYVPITFREWKPIKGTPDCYVVGPVAKEALWKRLKKNFVLPEHLDIF